MPGNRKLNGKQTDARVKPTNRRSQFTSNPLAGRCSFLLFGAAVIYLFSQIVQELMTVSRFRYSSVDCPFDF